MSISKVRRFSWHAGRGSSALTGTLLTEIWIRTIRLLMAVERSMQEQENYTNAVIVGAVRRANE